MHLRGSFAERAVLSHRYLIAEERVWLTQTLHQASHMINSPAYDSLSPERLALFRQAGYLAGCAVMPDSLAAAYTLAKI